MDKKELLYEGKAKKVFSTENPDYCIVSYKDDATAFNKCRLMKYAVTNPVCRKSKKSLINEYG